MWCLLFQHPISFTIDDDPAQYIKQYWSVLLLLFLWNISFAIHILSVNCRCFAINAGVDAISTPVRTCFALNTQPTPHSLSHIQAHTHTHTYFHIIASFVLQNRETESVSWELCAGKINPVRNFNFLSRWMGCKFSSHSSNLIICQNENWRNRRNGTLTWHRTFSSPLSTNMIWGKLFRFSSSFLLSFLGHAESWRRLLCSLFEGIFLQRKLFLWPAMAELCVCVAIKCEWEHSPPIINTPPSQQLRVSFDEHIASNYKQESTKVLFCHHYVPHRYL